MKTICLIILAALTLAAQSVPPGGSPPPRCIGSRTANCVPWADSSGNVAVGQTVLQCGSDLGACVAAAKAQITSNEDGSDNAVRIMLPEGTYTLSSPIELVSGLQMIGVMPRVQVVAGQAPDLDVRPNGGTWIDCGGASNTCITGSNLRGVILEKIGFKNFGKVASIGGSDVDGISFSRLQDIYAVGNSTVNESDKGLELYNIQHVRMDHLKFYRVNTGLHIISQMTAYQPGNSVISDFYVYTYPKSVANGNNSKPGLWLQVLKPTGAASSLNFLEFHRPQVNSFSGDGTGVQIIMAGYDAGAYVFGCQLHGVDIEGTSLYGVRMNYAGSNYVHLSASSGISNVFYLESDAIQNVLFSNYDRATIAPLSGNTNVFYGIFDSAPGGTGCGGSPCPMKGVYRLRNVNKTIANADSFPSNPTVIGNTTSISDDTSNSYIKGTGSGVLYLGSNNRLAYFIDPSKALKSLGVAFANLPGIGDGGQVYCSNCDTPASPGAACTSAGDKVGAQAFYVRGGWKCY